MLLEVISSSFTLHAAWSLCAILNAVKVEGLDEPPMKEAHKNDIKLFQNVYALVQSCLISEGVKSGDCLEMFRGADPNELRFGNCKCLIPCVAKKLDLMYTDGSYDFDNIRKLNNMIESDYYRKEAKRVVDICETEPGKDCEGGYNIINCAIQHSHVAGRSIRMMLEALDEHYAQSSKTDALEGDFD